LLAFSRRQTLDPKATSVNRLVTGMRDLINNTVGPSIDVRVIESPAIWTTLVDPNQLENALLNLCINARDAMPDGGQITIGTANCTFDLMEARARELRPGDYVSLAVSDTGIGMSDEVIQRGCCPESGWNLVWRILRSHEGIVSGGKVNWLINGFCGKGLPTIDLAHVDLP
jgi:signal transduction histidine kinase